MLITCKGRFAIVWTLTMAACGGGTDDAAREPEAGQAGGGKSEIGQDRRSTSGASGSAAGILDSFAQALADAGVPGPCGSCVRDRCLDSMSNCASDSKCIQGFVCVITQCMASGQAQSADSSARLGCTMACFQNDVPTALLAGSSATCIATACQDTCSVWWSRDAGVDVSAPGSGRSASGEVTDAWMQAADDVAAQSESGAEGSGASTPASDAAAETLGATRVSDAAPDVTRRANKNHRERSQ